MTAADGAFGTLDAMDAAQVREYERHFYLAYARLRPYLRLGARVLAGTAIGGKERFFLLWPIRELAEAAS